jgi:hypothetical protein
MIRRRPSKALLTQALIYVALGFAAIPAAVQAQQQRPDAQQPAKRPGKQDGDAAPGAPPARRDNPFAGPEDQKVLSFAGAWQEDVRYSGDPRDNPSGKGRWIARPVYGLYLVLSYEGAGPEGDYHAHGVMAYDHEDRAYRLWWFDDAGGIGEYTGAWKDDNTLVFEHKKVTGGRPFRERMTYTRVSETELTTKVEQAWGSEPYKFFFEASARRAQLQEGKGWGEKLSQQQPLKSRPNPTDAAPPKQGKPPA